MRIKATKLLLNGVVLGSILLPGILWGAVSLQDRQLVMQHAGTDAENTVRLFASNAKNIFDTHVLVGRLVNQYTRGMTWDEIARSHSLHKYLADLAHGYPQVQSIWLIDAEGNVRNSSATYTAPINASDRDYFTTLREHDVGIYIGKVVRGRVSQDDIFNVSQRRTSDDKFDGIVAVSVRADNFYDYWNKVDSGMTLILRPDGVIVACNQPLDGAPHQRIYQKVEGFPIYLGHDFNLDAAVRIWHADLYTYGIFFVISTCGLLSVSMLATHRLQQWQDTAEELHDEIRHLEQVEVQRRQAQKLNALGQMADRIAHDFGNILSVIVGSYDMLESNPDNCRFLKIGQEAAERGVLAVESLLAFARRQPQSIEMFDLGAMLRGMHFLIVQTVGPPIHVVSETVCCSPCQIKADRNQTELAILGLVTNASDAMPSGGQLRISTHMGTPDGMIGAFVALSIEDTGVGMSADIIARAFDPFYTTKSDGAGLGLSMVFNFAHEAHGTVTISSVPEHGTTVTLWLPLVNDGQRGGTVRTLKL